MMIPFRPQQALGNMAAAADRSEGAFVMKWVTPQATDFRFGMEITMYIANR
jgi:coenzyme PQQ precursor peptide PqqA